MTYQIKTFKSVLAAVVTLLIVVPGQAGGEPAPPAKTLTEAGLTEQPLTLELMPAAIAPLPSIAQEPAGEGTVTSINGLLIEPRFGISFTSGPGTGYESSYGSIYGFVPLWQAPGTALGFLEGQLSLATEDGDPSGNIILGYRNHVPDTDRVTGGYLAYDIRNTEGSTFHEVGMGVEYSATNWIFRINGYIPVGETQNITQDRSLTTTTLSDLGFRENLLAANRVTIESINREFEEALRGIDLEGGYQLYQWPGGKLWGYAGTYFYDGTETDGFAGFQARLAAEHEFLQTGLGLRTDGEFGTNILFSVALEVGGVPPAESPTSRTPTEESVLDRLAQSVERQDLIVVTQQQEVIQAITEEVVAVDNPGTAQPYRFLHVTLGATGGDGTFAAPFGSVGEAVAVAPTDGNTIIYVQAGTDPGIPAFAIPNNVQVRSTGPVQVIPGEVLGQSQAVTLPLSASGNFPLISDQVTVGNDTLLSGFIITPPANRNGIVGTDLSGPVAIADNRIALVPTNARVVGVLLDNVSVATITRNSFSTDGRDVDAIRVIADGGETLDGNLTISDNAFTLLNQDASSLEVLGSNGSNIGGQITYGGNDVISTAFGAENIRYGLDGSTLSAISVITDNAFSTVGGAAEVIELTFRNSSLVSGSTTISNNSFLTTGFDSDALVIDVLSGSNYSGAITLVNNTFSTSDARSNGISLRANDTSVINGPVTITGNEVATLGPGATGLLLESRNGLFSGPTTIAGNTISTAGDINNGPAEGIRIAAIANGTISNLDLSENVVNATGVNASGLSLIANQGTLSNVAIARNTIVSAGTANNNVLFGGLRVLVQNGGTTNDLTLTDNSISANTGFNGILLRSEGGNSTLSPTTLTNNLVVQAGLNGFRFENQGGTAGNLICVALRGNRVQQANLNGFSFVNVSPANNTLQLVDTDAGFSTTQATNVGSFAFTPSTAALTPLPVCP